MVPPAGLICPRSSQALLCHRATPARGRPRGTDEQVGGAESDAGDRRPADVDPMLRFISNFISTFCIRTLSLILMFYVREATGYFKHAGGPYA